MPFKPFVKKFPNIIQLKAKLIGHIHSAKNLSALLLPPETKMGFTQNPHDRGKHTHTHTHVYTHSLDRFLT